MGRNEVAEKYRTLSKAETRDAQASGLIGDWPPEGELGGGHLKARAIEVYTLTYKRQSEPRLSEVTR